jgi:MFS family permease
VTNQPTPNTPPPPPTSPPTPPTPAPAAPPGPSAGPPSEPERLTLGGQFGKTRDSFKGLLTAHIELLKAELAEIMDLVKVLGALAGGMIGCAFVVATMLYVGGFLFLGEWLFGSIGWGFAHGVLFGIALIINLALAFIGARGRSLVAALILALIVVFVVGFLCGSNAAYNAVAGVSTGLAQPLGQPGVVAILGGVIFGVVLFTLLLGRIGGRGGAVAGFFLGAFLGALLGWLIAGAPWTWAPAFGFAITIGLISWPLFAAVLAIPGLDIEARFSRLYPRQSIEAAEETRAWMEEQWRSRQPTLGRK